MPKDSIKCAAKQQNCINKCIVDGGGVGRGDAGGHPNHAPRP